MGLFLVTCTRTRAWTPASGPRTFLPARGTNNQSSQISLLPFACSKACFLSSIPKETEDHRPYPFRGIEESHGQGGGLELLQPQALPSLPPQPPSSSQPCWHPPQTTLLLWPFTTPSATDHAYPTLSVSPKFPPSPGSVQNSFAMHRMHSLCNIEPRLPSVTLQDRQPQHLPFTAPHLLPPTCLSHFLFSHFFYPPSPLKGWS